MFRRKTTDAPAPEPSDEVASPQGKGRPTPTRKEAEAARKAAVTGVPSDPKAARKAARDADKQARYEARLALQSGDVRRLPARDAGPVKAWVRDAVDGRRSAGELFIPVAVAVLVLGFVRIQWVQVVLIWAWAVMLVGVVLDSLWLIWRLRRELPEQFPDPAARKGAISYAVLRSLQLRRLRLPPPKVRANGQPVVPEGREVAPDPAADGVPLPRRARPQAAHRVGACSIGSSAVPASRSARSPTATGSPTGPRSRRTPRSPACNAALEAGITTFDTADVYAGTRAEEVLGKALRGQRREGLEIFTKVYWPTGPGVNDRGLSRKHIMREHATARCAGSAPTTSTSTRRTATTTRRRSRRRCGPSTTSCAPGKVLYVGVSEWDAEQIRRAIEIAEQMGFDRLVSNQPQYSMLWRVIEAEVVPACEELGLGQIVWTPDRAGRAHRQVPPRPAAARGLARHRPHERATSPSACAPTRSSTAGAGAQAARRAGRAVDGPARGRLGAAERQRRLGDHRREPPRAGHGERARPAACVLEPELLAAIDIVLGDVVFTDPSTDGLAREASVTWAPGPGATSAPTARRSR